MSPGYEFRLPSYPSTAFPSLTTAHAGMLARASDGTRGLRMFQGTDWFSLSGEVVNVKEFGAKGNGTDVTTQLQAALDVLPPGGAAFLPADEGVSDNRTVYGVTAPLRIHGGRKLFAANTGGNINGVTIRALAGFTGPAVIIDQLWDVNISQWWHYGALEDFTIDCNSIAAVGVAMHQLGEESVFRRIRVESAVASGFLLTGTHAPATLEECSAWFTPIGFKFTTHPDIATLPLKVGSGGVVRLFGPSGDDIPGTGQSSPTSKHFFFDGSHKVSALGIKSEGWPVGLRWEGADVGGGAGTAFLSGYFNAPAQTNAIEIGGTAEPHLVFAGLHTSGYTNWINDAVKTVTLPTATYNQLQGLLVYNGTTVLRPAEFVIETNFKGKGSGGALFSWQGRETNERVFLRASNLGNGAVGGTGGLALYASDGTLMMHLRKTANGGIDISQQMDLADAVDMTLGTTSGTKIGTSTAQKLAFWGQTPTTVSPAYTTAAISTGRVFPSTASISTDAGGAQFTSRADLEALVRVVAQMYEDLKGYGLLR